MQLNSFVVVVSKLGFVLEHTRPMGLDAATKTYKTIGKKYLSAIDDRVRPFGITGGIFEFSEEWINARLRMFHGNMELVAPLVIRHSLSVQKGNLIVELKHSSIA